MRNVILIWFIFFLTSLVNTFLTKKTERIFLMTGLTVGIFIATITPVNLFAYLGIVVICTIVAYIIMPTQYQGAMVLGLIHIHPLYPFMYIGLLYLFFIGLLLFKLHKKVNPKYVYQETMRTIKSDSKYPTYWIAGSLLFFYFMYLAFF